MSSHHIRGPESPNLVWTPVWLRGSHPADPRSSGRCSHSPSSHSTCRMSFPLITESVLWHKGNNVCVQTSPTSLVLWQEAEHPAVQMRIPLPAGQSPASSDTAWDTQDKFANWTNFGKKTKKAFCHIYDVSIELNMFHVNNKVVV